MRTPLYISTTPLVGPAGGRLTFSANTPVMNASVTAQTVIRYTPSEHAFIPIYDGNQTVWIKFVELTNDTTATSTGNAGPAAVAASKVYNMFAWRSAGVNYLTRSPAWTNDTTVGAGAGTAEIDYTTIPGLPTNKVAITNGPAANLGTWVGTVRSNGSSQMDWIYGALA